MTKYVPEFDALLTREQYLYRKHKAHWVYGFLFSAWIPFVVFLLMVIVHSATTGEMPNAKTAIAFVLLFVLAVGARMVYATKQRTWLLYYDSL